MLKSKQSLKQVPNHHWKLFKAGKFLLTAGIGLSTLTIANFQNIPTAYAVTTQDQTTNSQKNYADLVKSGDLTTQSISWNYTDQAVIPTGTIDTVNKQDGHTQINFNINQNNHLKIGDQIIIPVTTNIQNQPGQLNWALSNLSKIVPGISNSAYLTGQSLVIPIDNPSFETGRTYNVTLNFNISQGQIFPRSADNGQNLNFTETIADQTHTYSWNPKPTTPDFKENNTVDDTKNAVITNNTQGVYIRSTIANPDGNPFTTSVPLNTNGQDYVETRIITANVHGTDTPAYIQDGGWFWAKVAIPNDYGPATESSGWSSQAANNWGGMSNVKTNATWFSQVESNPQPGQYSVTRLANNSLKYTINFGNSQNVTMSKDDFITLVHSQYAQVSDAVLNEDLQKYSNPDGTITVPYNIRTSLNIDNPNDTDHQVDYTSVMTNNRNTKTDTTTGNTAASSLNNLAQGQTIVTTRYVDENGSQLAPSNIQYSDVNNKNAQYNSRSQNFDDYELDLTKLPQNAQKQSNSDYAIINNYADHDLTYTYVYKHTQAYESTSNSQSQSLSQHEQSLSQSTSTSDLTSASLSTSTANQSNSQSTSISNSTSISSSKAEQSQKDSSSQSISTQNSISDSTSKQTIENSQSTSTSIEQSISNSTSKKDQEQSQSESLSTNTSQSDSTSKQNQEASQSNSTSIISSQSESNSKKDQEQSQSNSTSIQNSVSDSNSKQEHDQSLSTSTSIQDSTSTSDSIKNHDESLSNSISTITSLSQSQSKQNQETSTSNSTSITNAQSESTSKKDQEQSQSNSTSIQNSISDSTAKQEHDKSLSTSTSIQNSNSTSDSIKNHDDSLSNSISTIHSLSQSQSNQIQSTSIVNSTTISKSNQDQSQSNSTSIENSLSQSTSNHQNESQSSHSNTPVQSNSDSNSNSQQPSQSDSTTTAQSQQPNQSQSNQNPINSTSASTNNNSTNPSSNSESESTPKPTSNSQSQTVDPIISASISIAIVNQNVSTSNKNHNSDSESTLNTTIPNNNSESNNDSSPSNQNTQTSQNQASSTESINSQNTNSSTTTNQNLPATGQKDTGEHRLTTDLFLWSILISMSALIAKKRLDKKEK